MKNSILFIVVSSFFSIQTYDYFPTKLQETLLFICNVMPESEDIVPKNTLQKLLTENNNLSKDNLIEIINYALLLLSHNENYYAQHGNVPRIMRYLNSQQRKLVEVVALETTKPRLRITRKDKKKSKINELCFNACMMSNNTKTYPDITLNTIYDSSENTLSINAWSMNNSAISQDPINVQFAIPEDFDTTKPVIVELHFFIRRFMENLGDTAHIQMNAVYIGAQDGMQVSQSAIGFNSEIVHSDDFTVIEPIDLFPQQSITHSIVKIPLHGALMANKHWAHLSFIRSAPTNSTSEYDKPIFLSMCVFKYNRILY